MRKNQMGVSIRRFGNQVSKGFRPPEKRNTYKDEYDNSGNPVQVIRIYADANDFYETWCAAFNETVQEIQRHENPCEKGELLAGKNQVDISVSCAYFKDNCRIFSRIRIHHKYQCERPARKYGNVVSLEGLLPELVIAYASSETLRQTV